VESCAVLRERHSKYLDELPAKLSAPIDGSPGLPVEDTLQLAILSTEPARSQSAEHGSLNAGERGEVEVRKRALVRDVDRCAAASELFDRRTDRSLEELASSILFDRILQARAMMRVVRD
jgi:hypothetical protein